MKELVKNGVSIFKDVVQSTTSAISHAIISDPERDKCIQGFINSVADSVAHNVKFEFNLYGAWQTISNEDADLVKADIIAKLNKSFNQNTLYQDRLFELSKFEAGNAELELLKANLVGKLQERKDFAAFEDDINDRGLSKHYFAQCTTPFSTVLNLITRFVWGFFFDDSSVYMGAFSYSTPDDSRWIQNHINNTINGSALQNENAYNDLIKTQPQSPGYCNYYIKEC